MKNSDYWKKRFQELEKRRYQSSVDMVRELEQVWDRASRSIQNDIEKWLNRIAKNNEISYQAARKLLEEDLLDEFHWTVEEYIRKGKENALNEKWMKQLENASARVHISRLEAMKIQLQQELEVLYAEYNNSVDEYLKNVYQDDYYHTAFEVAKGTSVGVDLHKISTADIEQVLKKPWLSDGKEFSSRIWDNKDKLVNLLDRELTQQIIRGTDPQKTINAVANKMNVSKSQAGTLVMTEAAAASSAARKQVFEDLDVERYEIVATLDLRTSEICRDMDGKVFKMPEYQPGETAPPFHPRCRTTTVPWFEDFQGNGKRAASNPETGKAEYVPENMTYKEWYRIYVEGNPSAELVMKKTKNESADRKQYRRYKETLGGEAPKSFEKFQDMKYTKKERWEELKEAYRDVNWQKKAQEKRSSGEGHSTPFQSEPNSVYDNYKGDVLLQRRYYGSTGKPRLDIDLTDHGNPKKHPVVPHRHGWKELQDGKAKRSEVHDMPLKLGDRIANSDIVKEAKNDD